MTSSHRPILGDTKLKQLPEISATMGLTCEKAAAETTREAAIAIFMVDKMDVFYYRNYTL